MYNKEDSNKDLMQLCEAVGAEIKAKNPNKPNKTELCDALDVYYGITADQKDDNSAADKAKTLTKAQKRRKQYEENLKLVRVLITSNATNQTKVPNQLITVGWGNRLLGYRNDRVILGKEWHIRQGALNNLKSRTISSPVQNEEQNRIDYITIPAYNIVDLGLLSMEEYRKMGEKQRAKDASLAVQ